MGARGAVVLGLIGVRRGHQGTDTGASSSRAVVNVESDNHQFLEIILRINL